MCLGVDKSRMLKIIVRNMIIAKRIVPLKYEEDTLNFLNADF